MRNPPLIIGTHYRGLPLHHSDYYPPAFRERWLEITYQHLVRMCHQHNKTLFIRYDLHFPPDIEPVKNLLFSQFINRFDQEQKSRGYDPRHIWCREVGPLNGRVHYHCIILLNCSEVQTIKGVLTSAKIHWLKTLGLPLEPKVNETDYSHLIDYCKKRMAWHKHNGIQLRRNEADFHENFEYAFRWASYLCKVYSKGDSPLNVREFQGSRQKAIKSPLKPALQSLPQEPQDRF